MESIHISADLYKRVKSRAKEAGFESVDAYVADVLESEPRIDDAYIQSLFTPDRMAIIEKAEAQIEAGEYYTVDEVREHLATRRDDWLKKNQK